MKIFIMKKWSYLLAIIVFLIMIAVGWYIFFCLEIFNTNDKRIVGIISYYGLVFGIFQFTINQINIRNRRLYDLRLSTYRELIKQIDTIIQTINDKLGTTDEFDFHGYVTKLLNLINQFTLYCRTYQDLIFPGLSKTKEFQFVRDIMYDVLETTDKFRKAIDVGKDSEIYKSFKRIDWHNEIRQKLKDLHEKKYDYFNLIRKYI